MTRGKTRLPAAQVVCGYEHDSMGSTVGEDARVIQCLQDYRCALSLLLVVSLL